MSSPSPERNLHAKDLLTAASAITATGGTLGIVGGLHLDTLWGYILFTAARGSDNLDGAVARALDQVSDAGALFDTIMDKSGVAAAAVTSWKKELVPRPVIAAITARSLASVGLTLLMARNHPNESFRPTDAGKATMAAESVAFLAFAGAKLAETKKPESIKLQKIARGIGYAAFATILTAGTVSIAQYAKRAFEKPEDQPE